MELDEIADELYAVPPEQFVAARTTRQDEARAAGDRALAKAIAGLPKPSTAAWVCNLLVRAQREEIEGLVELGDLLRDAQQNLAGDELKALNRQRAQLLTALTRQAAALARGRGHAVSSAIAGQVEETLRAAMTDPEAGEALLGGRLTGAMSYSGLGTTGVRAALRLVQPPEPAPATTPARPPRSRVDPAEQRRRQEAERRRREAEEQRRRALAEAQRAAEEAEAVADEAEAAAQRARRDADAADARGAELRARAAELAEETARAEREAAAAAQEADRARRRRRTAEREAADAAAARDAARSRLTGLVGDG